jgi:hypothetical protein
MYPLVPPQVLSGLTTPEGAGQPEVVELVGHPELELDEDTAADEVVDEEGQEEVVDEAEEVVDEAEEVEDEAEEVVDEADEDQVLLVVVLWLEEVVL